MKRIIYILFCLILIFTLAGSTVSFAEEVAEDPETSVEAEPETETEADETVSTEEPTTEVAPPSTESVQQPPTDTTTVAPETETTTQPAEPSAAEQNVFTRLYEAFDRYKRDIGLAGGGTVLFVLSLLLKKNLKDSTKSLAENITNVLTKANVSDEKQNAIVGGLNEMVDGYNQIREQSDQVREKIAEYGEQISTIYESNCALEKKMEDIFHVIITLIDKEITQNAEVMDVLASVYVNNKALPQGVKDYVSLIHSKNAKIVQEAAELTHKTEGGATNE